MGRNRFFNSFWRLIKIDFVYLLKIVLFYFKFVCIWWKNKLKIRYWSVGIRLHCRTERLGLSLQSTWINQFSSRKKRKNARAEGSDTETPFLLLKRWTKTCMGGRLGTEKGYYWARHESIVPFCTFYYLGTATWKLSSCWPLTDSAQRPCLHGASPGSFLLLSSLPFPD